MKQVIQSARTGRLALKDVPEARVGSGDGRRVRLDER